MKRRVNLAIGVMHEPQVLFLDEPTVGVDVQSRHAIINYLKELNENGTTLIYTSHQLEEAAELCNKIALMDDGKIIAHDSLEVTAKNTDTREWKDCFWHSRVKDSGIDMHILRATMIKDRKFSCATGSGCS